jgi:hypothetical protein
MLQAIQSALASTDLGEAALKDKPSTRGLYRVRIPYPEGLMDAPGKTAWVDTKKNEFFLNVHGGMPRPDGTQINAWYGPISLDVAAPASDGQLSDASRAKLMEEFNKNRLAGTLQWERGQTPIERRPNVVHEEELIHEKHPDGFTYTAVLKVGESWRPPSEHADPDSVKEFYVKRTGGLAGLTQHAGPFSLGSTDD